MSVTRLAVLGFGWAAAGSGLRSLLRLGVLVVLARIIAPGDFGLLGASLVVVGFAEIFCFIGVSPAVVQRSDLRGDHIRSALWIAVLLSCAFGGLVFVLSPLIADLFRMPRLEDVVRVIAFVFPVHGIGLVPGALLQRELRFRAFAVIDLFAVAAYGLTGIALGLAGHGVFALVFAYLTHALVQAGCYWRAAPPDGGGKFAWKAASELLSFGVGASAAQIANYLARQGDNFVVGRWLGSAALGLYGRAYALMMAPVSVFGQVLDRVLFAAVSNVQQEPVRVARAFRRSVSLVALVTMPASAVLGVFAPEIVWLLLGPDWEGVVPIFRILAAGMFFRIGYKVAGATGRGTGVVYRLAWRQAVYASLVVAGAYIGQRWGLAGVAWSTVFALFVQYTLLVGLMLGVIGLTWRQHLLDVLPGAGLGLTAVAMTLGVSLGAGSLGISSWIAAGFGTSLVLGSIAYVIARWPTTFLDVHGWRVVGELAVRLPGYLKLRSALPGRIVGLIEPRPVEGSGA